MFKIGQKVVCIDDAPPITKNGADYLMCRPKRGEVYTVREIHVEPSIPDAYGIRLEELPNSSMIWDDGSECEWSFSYTRFRPVEDTDKQESAAKVAVI